LRISEYTVVQKSIRFLSLLELPHYTSTNANTNLVSIHKDLVYVFVCYLFYYYVFHSHCVLSNIDNWICFPETTKLTNIMSISFLLPLTVSFQIISFSHQSVVLTVEKVKIGLNACLRFPLSFHNFWFIFFILWHDVRLEAK